MTHREDIDNFIAGPYLKTTVPLNWDMPPTLKAVRRQWLETYRHEHSRGSMVRVADKIIETLDANRATIAPSTMRTLVWGAGNVVGHLLDIGAIRKIDNPSGSFHYALTPYARGWAMYVRELREHILDGSWPPKSDGLVTP